MLITTVSNTNTTALATNLNNLEFQNEKHLVVDSVEASDELYKYIDIWDAAAEDLSSEYPHQMKFVAKQSVSKEQIDSILSKYDTNYLFVFNLTHEFTIESLKFYFDNKGEIRSFRSRYHQFEGEAFEYVKIIKYFLQSPKYIVTGLNGVPYDSYEFKINSVAANFNYCNEESEYMLRFSNKEEFEKAYDELENDKDIDVIYTRSYKDKESLEPEEMVDGYNTLYVSPDFLKPGVDELTECLIPVSSRNDTFVGEKLTAESQLEALLKNITETSRIGRIQPKGCTKPKNIPLKDITPYDFARNIPTVIAELGRDPNVPVLEWPHPKERIPEFVEDICGGKLIYRIYNIDTGEHLFTSSRKEHDKLVVEGGVVGNPWVTEGVSCIVYTEDEDIDKPVYRIYNPNVEGGDHHYTHSKKEAEKRVSDGWKWDFGGKPAFYTGGDKEGYRLYNKNDGRHHYTFKEGEKNKLVKLGWEDEGKSWEASDKYGVK